VRVSATAITLVYKRTLTGSVLYTLSLSLSLSHTPLVSCRDAVLMASVLPPENSFFESEHSSSTLHNFRFKYPYYECISPQKTKQSSGYRPAVLNKQNKTPIAKTWFSNQMLARKFCQVAAVFLNLCETAAQ